MAGPITHIVLAMKALPLLNVQDIQEFIVGTSFPDIRHLGSIDRGSTHDHSKVLRDVQTAPSPFAAGMLFHSLVDTVREDFMVEHGLYSKIEDLPHIVVAVKFYEDQLLYNKIKNWYEIESYFGKPLPDELVFGASKDQVSLWHKLIRNYCSEQPSQKSRRQLIVGMNPSEKTKSEAKLFETELQKIEKKQDIISPLSFELYDKFTDIITN